MSCGRVLNKLLLQSLNRQLDGWWNWLAYHILEKLEAWKAGTYLFIIPPSSLFTSHSATIHGESTTHNSTATSSGFCSQSTQVWALHCPPFHYSAPLPAPPYFFQERQAWLWWRSASHFIFLNFRIWVLILILIYCMNYTSASLYKFSLVASYCFSVNLSFGYSLLLHMFYCLLLPS